MIKAVYEKQPKNTGGGYARWEGNDLFIFVSSKGNKQQKRMTAIHEVLHAHLSGRVAHKRIDPLCADILDVLLQLEL
jgi:uncharacterized protein YfaQ (DUF2300 family)